MYAVIKAGGHQYQVSQGETLTVDRIEGNVGDEVKFDKVLMIGGAAPKFGTPLVAGAGVKAVIKEQTRAPKIIVFKYKRRKNYKKQYGHKQPQTVIEIASIDA